MLHQGECFSLRQDPVVAVPQSLNVFVDPSQPRKLLHAFHIQQIQHVKEKDDGITRALEYLCDLSFVV